MYQEEYIKWMRMDSEDNLDRYSETSIEEDSGMDTGQLSVNKAKRKRKRKKYTSLPSKLDTWDTRDNGHRDQETTDSIQNKEGVGQMIIEENQGEDTFKNQTNKQEKMHNVDTGTGIAKGDGTQEKEYGIQVDIK